MLTQGANEVPGPPRCTVVSVKGSSLGHRRKLMLLDTTQPHPEVREAEMEGVGAQLSSIFRIKVTSDPEDLGISNIN